MSIKTSCDVAVVGGGLAGLAAADFLTQSGLDVKLFEAENRVGGRVYTARLPSHVQFEQGAFSFADVESTLINYLWRFSLKTTPASTIDKQFKFGTIIGHFSDKGTFLEGVEKTIVLNNLLFYYLPNVPNDDTITFANGLRKAGASEPAIAWLNLNTLAGLQGNGIETVSAFAAKQFMAQYAGATGFNTVRGGNDLLPHALGQALRDRVYLNSPIQEIQKQTDSYVLTGPTQTITAEQVVLTVPLAGLKQIEFQPSLPQDKWQAILSVPYTSCSRLSLIGPPNIFGTTRGGVFAITDQPAGWFRDQTLFQGSTSQNTVFDTSFVGPTARQMDGMTNESRKKAVIDGLRYFYPSVPSQEMQVQFFSWDRVPWVRGGYSYFPPHTISLQLILKRPEGGLYFAGEHTSEKYASMNGALESGLRAAKEVLHSRERV